MGSNSAFPQKWMLSLLAVDLAFMLIVAGPSAGAGLSMMLSTPASRIQTPKLGPSLRRLFCCLGQKTGPGKMAAFGQKRTLNLYEFNS